MKSLFQKSSRQRSFSSLQKWLLCLPVICGLTAGISSSSYAALDFRGYGPFMTPAGPENPEIPGFFVADLLAAEVYPDTPDWVETVGATVDSDGSLGNMRSTGLFQYPQDIATGFSEDDSGVDNFGIAVSGVFYAWKTGSYVFYIRSDDASQLFISDDETRDQLPSRPSAEEPACCNPFLNDSVRNTGPILLEIGEARLIEALLKKGYGKDFLEIGVSVDGGPIQTLSMRHVQRDVNAPGGVPASVDGITQDPIDLTVNEGARAIFFIEFDRDGAAEVQWQVNEGEEWVNIEGAISPVLIIEQALLESSANQYRALVDEVASNPATLSVIEDNTKPSVLSAVGSGSPQGIIVTFNEPVDKESATTLSNYTIPGRTISSATLIADNQVLLSIGTFNANPFNLTIRNVEDRATPGNVMSPVTFFIDHDFSGSLFYFYEVQPGREENFGLDRYIGEEFRGNGEFLSDPRATPNAFSNLAEGNIENFGERFSGLAPYFEVPNTGSIFVPPNKGFPAYGLVTTGYIVPKQTGNYNFVIASGGNAELYLSINDNPSSAVLIAEEPARNNVREWNGTENIEETPEDETNSNVSGPIQLFAGDRYYYELHSEHNASGSHAAVAWTMTDVAPEDGAAPITGDFLEADLPYDQLIFSKPPKSVPATELREVTFSAKAICSHPFVIGYQWLRDGKPVPGATGETWTLTTSLDMDGSQISVRAFNRNGTFNSITSPQVTLTVEADTTAPELLDVYGTPLKDKIVILFDETLNAASAQTATNYSVTKVEGGESLEVTGATLHDDSRTVALTTAEVEEGVEYEVTASNVEDLFGNAGDGTDSFFSFESKTGGLTFLFYNNAPAPERPLTEGTPGGLDSYPTNFATFGDPFRNPFDMVESRQSGTTQWYEVPAGDNIALAGESNQDDYSLILFGYLKPQVDGWYRLAMTADDNGDLFLSTNDIPENVVHIASVTSETEPRDFGENEDTNQSDPIFLSADQLYWIESYSTETDLGDHHSASWIGPFETEEAAASAEFETGQSPIPAEYLYSTLPVYAEPYVEFMSPTGVEVPLGLPVRAVIRDGRGSTVVDDSVTLFIDGVDTGAVGVRSGETVEISFTPEEYDLFTEYLVTVYFTDSDGTNFSEEWTFRTTDDSGGAEITVTVLTDGDLMLEWNDTAFNLVSSPNVEGPYSPTGLSSGAIVSSLSGTLFYTLEPK